MRGRSRTIRELLVASDPCELGMCWFDEAESPTQAWKACPYASWMAFWIMAAEGYHKRNDQIRLLRHSLDLAKRVWVRAKPEPPPKGESEQERQDFSIYTSVCLHIDNCLQRCALLPRQRRDDRDRWSEALDEDSDRLTERLASHARMYRVNISQICPLWDTLSRMEQAVGGVYGAFYCHYQGYDGPLRDVMAAYADMEDALRFVELKELTDSVKVFRTRCPGTDWLAEEFRRLYPEPPYLDAVLKAH